MYKVNLLSFRIALTATMALSMHNRRSVADGNLGLLQVSFHFICMVDRRGCFQEFVRKDPESYREEFVEQFHHFQQTMKLLQLQPAMHRMEIQPLLELVTFLSGVAFCYPGKWSRPLQGNGWFSTL